VKSAIINDKMISIVMSFKIGVFLPIKLDKIRKIQTGQAIFES